MAVPSDASQNSGLQDDWDSLTHGRTTSSSTILCVDSIEHWLQLSKLARSFQSYSSRSDPTRLRLTVSCQYRPHCRFFSPSRLATFESSLVLVAITVVCEDDVSSPLLFSWQHLLAADESVSRFRPNYFPKSSAIAFAPNPILPPRMSGMNSLSPLLKP